MKFTLILFILSSFTFAQSTGADCKKKGLKFDRKNRKCKEGVFTSKKKKCDKLKLKWDDNKGSCEFSVEILKEKNQSEFNAWTEKCKKKGYEINISSFTSKGRMRCDRTKTVAGASNKKVKRANKKKAKKECAIKGFKIKAGEGDTFVCDESKKTRKRTQCESRSGEWNVASGKCSTASKLDQAKQKILGVKGQVDSKIKGFQNSTDEKAKKCYIDGLQFNPTLRKCGKEKHDDYNTCLKSESKEWSKGRCVEKLIKVAPRPAKEIEIAAPKVPEIVELKEDPKKECLTFKQSTSLFPDSTMKFVDSHARLCARGGCKCYQSEVHVCNSDKKEYSKRGAMYVGKSPSAVVGYVKNDYKNYTSKYFPLLVKEIDESSVKVVDDSKCGSLGYLETMRMAKEDIKRILKLLKGEVARPAFNEKFTTKFNPRKCEEFSLDVMPEYGGGKRYAFKFSINFVSGSSPQPITNNNISLEDIIKFGEDDYAKTILEEVFRGLQLEKCF